MRITLSATNGSTQSTLANTAKTLILVHFSAMKTPQLVPLFQYPLTGEQKVYSPLLMTKATVEVVLFLLVFP